MSLTLKKPLLWGFFFGVDIAARCQNRLCNIDYVRKKVYFIAMTDPKPLPQLIPAARRAEIRAQVAAYLNGLSTTDLVMLAGMHLQIQQGRHRRGLDASAMMMREDEQLRSDDESLQVALSAIHKASKKD